MWFGKKSSSRDRRILLLSKALNCATLWTMFKTGVNHKQDVTHWYFVASAPEADTSSFKKASSHVGERNFQHGSPAEAGMSVPTSRDTHSNHQTRYRNKQTRLRRTQLQKLSAQAVILSIMSLTLTKCTSEGNCYGNFDSLISSAFLTFK